MDHIPIEVCHIIFGNYYFPTIFTTDKDFSVLFPDGTVYTSYQRLFGESPVATEIQSMTSNRYAFAAITYGGDIETWGDMTRGGGLPTRGAYGHPAYDRIIAIDRALGRGVKPVHT